MSPWIRRRAVQTRTIVFGTVAVGAALFLDLAVLDVTTPIADGGSATPAVTDPPAAPVDSTAIASLPTLAPATTPTPTSGLVSVPSTVAPTEPPAAGSSLAPAVTAVASPPGAPVAADATPRTPTATPVAPNEPVTTVTTIPPSRPVTPVTTVATEAPTTQATTTAAPTTQATTTTQAPAAVEYRTYGVGSVGSVVLAYTGSSISLSSTALGSGWTYRAESNGPRSVKLNFFNTDTQQEAEWKATIESGRILIEN